jgi:hypothetical protein
MFARLAVATGWTLGEIRDLSFPDFLTINHYFEEVPPLHVLAAAYLGVLKEPKKLTTDDDLRQLAGLPGVKSKKASEP